MQDLWYHFPCLGKSPSWTDPKSNSTIREIMLDAAQPEPWVDSSASTADGGGADDPPAVSWSKCLFFLGETDLEPLTGTGVGG